MSSIQDEIRKLVRDAKQKDLKEQTGRWHCPGLGCTVHVRIALDEPPVEMDEMVMSNPGETREAFERRLGEGMGNAFPWRDKP